MYRREAPAKPFSGTSVRQHRYTLNGTQKKSISFIYHLPSTSSSAQAPSASPSASSWSTYPSPRSRSSSSRNAISFMMHWQKEFRPSYDVIAPTQLHSNRRLDSTLLSVPLSLFRSSHTLPPLFRLQQPQPPSI